jgi:hypothetical protein
VIILVPTDISFCTTDVLLQDMRGALTRAMTSAVVGKVINMTISRAKLPQWTAWLNDWTRDDGAKVELRRIQTMPEENAKLQDSTPAVT